MSLEYGVLKLFSGLIHEQHGSNPNMAVKSFLARSVRAGNLGVCKRICSLMAQRGMKTQVLTMWRSRTALRPVMHRTLKLKCCTLYAVILCMYDEDEDTDMAFCTDYQLTVPSQGIAQGLDGMSTADTDGDHPNQNVILV